MAFWSIGGNVATTIGSDGFPSGVDNDAGTIRNGGTIASTRFESKGFDQGTYITVVSGVNGVTGVLAGGTFNGGDQIIVRYTTDLGGITNNALLFGASDSANESKSINQVAVVQSKLYKTAVRNGDWNVKTGAFSPAVGVVNSGAWDITRNGDTSATVATSGTDNAANPTSTVPGELVYMHGALADPTTDEYQPKQLW